MKSKSYFFKTLLFTLILIPLMLSIIGIITMFLGLYLYDFFAVVCCVGVVGAIVILYLIWKNFAGKREIPESAFERYLPFAVTVAYHLTVWIIAFTAASYAYTSDFTNTVAWLSPTYLVFNIFYGLAMPSFPFMFSLFPCIVNAVSIIIFTIVCIRKNKRPVNIKGVLVLPSVILVLAAVISLQFYHRSGIYISVPYGNTSYSTVKDDIELEDYLPYTNGSKLEKFYAGTPNLIISSDYPKLDGATALYPVYVAVAQAVYDGLGINSIEFFVMCTKTASAYERLINGEVDIIFAAQPSEQQKKMAEENGVELTLTPIAREAFVFTVNASNPVENLTVKQIQDIYTRKITNWKSVGGNDEKIIAFQRPENSGSQTMMLAAVMKDKKLPEPLREEYMASMGGLITQVADYVNYSASIGYSFRFFATEMNKGADIKLLSIEGVEPTVENIASGTYPFTGDVYAITAGTKNSNVRLLLDWILSEQGQDFIEQCGYVRLK